MMLSDRRRLDEAVPMLERLVALAPDNPDGWTALGVACSRNRDLEGSGKAFRRALEIDPGIAYALRNLATTSSPRRRSAGREEPLLTRAHLCLRPAW
jgi:Flp pilus assembly protein TadD